MTYVIVEIQTHANGSVGHLTYQLGEKNGAEEKYHTCLAAAAVSALPCHAVAMLDEQGRLIKREMYKHDTEASEGESNG